MEKKPENERLVHLKITQFETEGIIERKPNPRDFGGQNLNWAVLSGEQMSKGWPFSLLNDEQMSNWLGVGSHQPVNFQVFFRDTPP